jgi:hypothetical protein
MNTERILDLLIEIVKVAAAVFFILAILVLLLEECIQQ